MKIAQKTLKASDSQLRCLREPRGSTKVGLKGKEPVIVRPSGRWSELGFLRAKVHNKKKLLGTSASLLVTRSYQIRKEKTESRNLIAMASTLLAMASNLLR